MGGARLDQGVGSRGCLLEQLFPEDLASTYMDSSVPLGRLEQHDIYDSKYTH
eukprot:COSAG01_NODE_7992_length_2961_cov_69.700210_4_plen_52_part_00